MRPMGVKSMYSEAQWQWVRDRILVDGYAVLQISELIGTNPSTVYKHLNCHRGPKHKRNHSLPDIATRRKEFCDLMFEEA